MRGLLTCVLTVVVKRLFALIPGFMGTTPHEEFVSCALIWLSVNEILKLTLFEQSGDKGKKVIPQEVGENGNTPAEDC